MLELSPIFGHHTTKLYFKRLFRETQSPILSQCKSVREVKIIEQFPSDQQTGLEASSAFFFSFYQKSGIRTKCVTVGLHLSHLLKGRRRRPSDGK